MEDKALFWPASLSPPGQWAPRLDGPRSCPGHPLALVKPARGRSGRTFVGLALRTGTVDKP
eukprot:scaffold39115_cov65-Phaeocystis_antarctica.AAC.2